MAQAGWRINAPGCEFDSHSRRQQQYQTNKKPIKLGFKLVGPLQDCFCPFVPFLKVEVVKVVVFEKSLELGCVKVWR